MEHRHSGMEWNGMEGQSMLDNLTVCPPPSDVQSGPVGLDLKVWSSYVSVSNLVGTSCRERERERERER